MIKQMIRKVKKIFEFRCKQCNQIANTFIEHEEFLGYKAYFLVGSVRCVRISRENVCTNCFEKYKTKNKLETLEIIKMSDEYINGRHYLNNKRS